METSNEKKQCFLLTIDGEKYTVRKFRLSMGYPLGKNGMPQLNAAMEVRLSFVVVGLFDKPFAEWRNDPEAYKDGCLEIIEEEKTKERFEFTAARCTTCDRYVNSVGLEARVVLAPGGLVVNGTEVQVEPRRPGERGRERPGEAGPDLP